MDSWVSISEDDGVKKRLLIKGGEPLPFGSSSDYLEVTIGFSGRLFGSEEIIDKPEIGEFSRNLKVRLFLFDIIEANFKLTLF